MNRIYSYDVLVKLLAEHGYTPCFTAEEYTTINRQTIFAMKDSEGYKMLLNYDALSDKSDVNTKRRFHRKNPFVIENINNWIKLNLQGRYMCLSDKYIGSRELLKFKCLDCGAEFEKSWTNFSRRPESLCKCPECQSLATQSLHAVILKQLFLRLKPGTVSEDRSCINPKTSCALPTDIVNHNEKIAIEIQSWFHDREEQKEKDQMKKEYWINKGYTFYSLDIREYNIIQMCQIFFPELDEIPDWVDIHFGDKLNIFYIQNQLNNGMTVSEISKELNIKAHRIYDNIQNGKLFYPVNYKTTNRIKNDYILYKSTVQTAGY